MEENLQENPQQQAPQISKDQELAALEQELAQSEASLEQNLAGYLATNLSEEYEELFFENREEFFKKILEMQNAWIKENIQSKVERAQTLQGEIMQEEQYKALDLGRDMFLQKHPEVNFNALMEFANTQLSPAQLAELEKLPPDVMFEEIYKLMQGGRSEKPKEKAEKLPKKVQGAPADASAYESDVDLPTRRFQ
ncbi:MAG: hypothetical protein PUB96_08700 [Helicobacteraceae bacterium]|nr:hypothetical protein [Helicobacteraceae bacterium]